MGTLTAQTQTTTGVTYNSPTSVTSTSTVVVTATSIHYNLANATLNITVVPPPQITATTMPNGTVGTAYSKVISMTNGVAPYAWTIVAGPAGLTLAASTTNSVTVQGTPTTAGANQVFTIKVTDAQGLSYTSSSLAVPLTVTVTGTATGAPAITSTNSTSFTVGSAGSFTVTTTGTPTPTLSEVGALPNLLTFVDNHDGTATIGGTAAIGTDRLYPMVITAHNGVTPDAVQTFFLTVATAPPSVFIPNETIPVPIFANGNTESILVVVANDLAGDVLTSNLTVGGVACTTTTCGTMQTTATFVSLNSGVGNYTLSYTPPTPTNLTKTTTFTLVVSSSLATSFASTTTFDVNPAGAILVVAPGPNARVLPTLVGTVNLVAMVYNDVTQAGATFSLLGSGYACPPGTGGTICGFVSSGGPSFGTTSTATTGIPFTRYAFGYRGPSAVPAARRCVRPPYASSRRSCGGWRVSAGKWDRSGRS